MAYFADLSRYAFVAAGSRAARNVGWLDENHAFPTEPPHPELLRAIWEYCMFLVMPTRGLHSCALCKSGNNTFCRQDTKLTLGSGEIRVFSASGDTYAAPNMIYHYVLEHHYRPPEEFLQAIEQGPRPGSDEYVGHLEGLHVPWRANLPLAVAPKAFTFARTENGTEVQEMPGATKK
jgi:hypothetical protein